MTNADRVLTRIMASPGLSDADLVAATGIQPHQQVNGICRRLASEGRIERRQRADGILGNYPTGPSPAPTWSATDQVGPSSQPAGEALMRILKPADGSAAPEYEEVKLIATGLLAHLRQPAVATALQTANQPGLPSHGVQQVVTTYLVEVGFARERAGLFAHSQVPSLRPDFYRAVGDTGILFEVERGKTIDNNMDLLDYWKTHICVDASYLFLMVPLAYVSNPSRSATPVFERVARRLSTLFLPDTLTSVRGVFLFGY